MSRVRVMFLREKCDWDCAIREGRSAEGSGHLYMRARLGKGVFWYANESSRLVFNSEVGERLVIVGAYNTSDSRKRVVVGGTVQ